MRDTASVQAVSEATRCPLFFSGPRRLTVTIDPTTPRPGSAAATQEAGQ
ncbi:hypothetical protein AB0I94_14145 [Streptomyces sp. NPDC050147]